MKNCGYLALLSLTFQVGAQDIDFPPELVRFASHKANPVFAAQPGQWDAAIRERGWILLEEGVWKLWYTGYDGTKEGIRRLGYATSRDGVTWTRHPKNPLVADEWIEDVMIVKDGDRYVMFAEGRGDQAHWFESRDGLAWRRRGSLDIRTAVGKRIPPGPYGTPTVFKEKDTWYLFYERNDAGVWLATSKDLCVWTNVRDEPILKPGPGAYDRDLIALNQIVKVGNRYFAYYHGCANVQDKSKRLWCTCIAGSRDLIHWEKYPGNPLLPLAENKSSGIVVHDGKGYRLYTMHGAVHVHMPVP